MFETNYKTYFNEWSLLIKQSFAEPWLLAQINSEVEHSLYGIFVLATWRPLLEGVIEFESEAFSESEDYDTPREYGPLDKALVQTIIDQIRRWHSYQVFKSLHLVKLLNIELMSRAEVDSKWRFAFDSILLCFKTPIAEILYSRGWGDQLRRELIKVVSSLKLNSLCYLESTPVYRDLRKLSLRKFSSDPLPMSISDSANLNKYEHSRRYINIGGGQADVTELQNLQRSRILDYRAQVNYCWRSLDEISRATSKIEDSRSPVLQDQKRALHDCLKQIASELQQSVQEQSQLNREAHKIAYQHAAQSLPADQSNFQRYTNISIPEQGMVSIPLTLMVQLTVIQVHTDNATRMQAVHVPLLSSQQDFTFYSALLTVFISAPAFELDHSVETLLIPFGQDTKPLFFMLTPTLPGSHAIEIEFYHETSRIGYAIATVEIHQNSGLAK